MSLHSENPNAVKRNFSQERKISFKGLEKCLEAFTSGEGRVVRKYARLLSQLSGKQQEDEDGVISWSSSDEDNPGLASQNITICRRSTFTRKLNSQIDFETRIRSKVHGRRLTRAHFSRSVGHLSQDPVGSTIRAESLAHAYPIPEESRPSILDTSFLVENSQISLAEAPKEKEVSGFLQDQLRIAQDKTLRTNLTPGASRVLSEELCPSTLKRNFVAETSQICSKGKEILEADLPLELTPRTENSTNGCDTISPVFKMKSKNSAFRRRFKYKVRSSNKKTVEDIAESCSGAQKSLSVSSNNSFSGDRTANEEFLTSSEVKKISADENAENYHTSPILESRASRRLPSRKSLSTPRDANVLLASPIVRKSDRIRKLRARTTQKSPISPVLEPKAKSVAFKRKRRKIEHENTSPTPALNEMSTEFNISTSPIIGQNLKIQSPTTIDSYKHFVKRSLNFDLKDSGNNIFLEKEDYDTHVPHTVNETSLQEKSPVIDLNRLQIILSNTESVEGQEKSETEPETLTKSKPEFSAFRKPLLNETNLIEEVYTEELSSHKSPELFGGRKKSLSLQKKNCPLNSNKRKSSNNDPVSQGIIEENSQTQALVLPLMNKTNPINLNRTVFIDEDSETQNFGAKSVDKTATELRFIEDNHDIARKKLHGTFLIDEDSQSQYIPDTPTIPRSTLNEKKHNNEPEKFSVSPAGVQRTKIKDGEPKSRHDFTSVQQASEAILNEFHPVSRPEQNSGIFKRPSFVLKSTDHDVMISQSSTRSGNNDNHPHVNGGRTGSPEIESVSSQASRGNLQTDKPPDTDIAKSTSNTKSPVVSSPMVISSVGSSPDVRRVTDFPFVVVEDEYNAPPKRRSKKLDPNGIAARLQRLMNQRRSAAHIWQFKRSKLNRLGDKDKNRTEETPRGRILSVRSVYVESSHVVLSTKEIQGELAVGRPFRSNVLVVLDPGVVFRLGKIMTASSIEIFPPWQAMDLAERNTTVVLGANIVEVLSTEQLLNKSSGNIEEHATVQKYTCQCVPPLPDAVVLDCWDGAQTLGLLDILFPREAPPCSQLLHCDDSIEQGLNCSNSKDAMFKQHKYSIQEMLSTHSTANHGKGHLVLTILRVLCFWQRSGETINRRHSLPHWSVIGEDDGKEVCEVVLGPVSSSKDLERLDWSDFLTGKALGRKYKFRGLAVSQRLNRSRYCGTWTAFPENQKIVYVLVPSNQFSLTMENPASHRKAWEPEVTTLAKLVNNESLTNECGLNTPTRVTTVCRVFHANEYRLYVGDHSISPQLCSVVLQPSVFIPKSIFVAVKKPKPTKLLVLLQDVEVSKGILTADKLSRVLPLNDKGYAYEENSFRRNWPVAQEINKAISSAMAILPLFSLESSVHSVVLLTGSVSGVEESSALIWPACGVCGSPVNTEETATSNALHFCAECARVSEQLVVHMSLVVLVSCAGFSEDHSVRVKLLQNTIQVLLRAMPKEGQDYTVREALGKPIGPIRCEVTSAHNGNFVLQELPTSLWK